MSGGHAEEKSATLAAGDAPQMDGGFAWTHMGRLYWFSFSLKPENVISLLFETGSLYYVALSVPELTL